MPTTSHSPCRAGCLPTAGSTCQLACKPPQQVSDAKSITFAMLSRSSPDSGEPLPAGAPDQDEQGKKEAKQQRIREKNRRAMQKFRTRQKVCTL